MYKTAFQSAADSNSDDAAALAPVRLQFQSCSFYCRIWVNGQEVGDHLAGGYVAFFKDVPAAVRRSTFSAISTRRSRRTAEAAAARLWLPGCGAIGRF
eukprot:SAG11_NODE_985_length_6288_cov_53.468972_5_plen_98_part_00